MAVDVLPDHSMFLSDYLNDAREDFQVANRALLVLEQDPDQPERVNEIFRAVHTLKSSSAMLGFISIAELAHFTEDVLDRIRSKELPLSQSAIDILLEAFDTLEVMVRKRAAGQSEEEQAAGTSIEDLKRRVSALESAELLVRQGVIVIDDTGLIEAFNPAAERLFGYAAAEIVGRRLELLLPGPSRTAQESDLASSLRATKPNVYGAGGEVIGVRQNGSPFAVEVAYNEVSLSGRVLCIAIVREITRRETRAAGPLAIEKSNTIRVRVDLLDSLFNLVGEIIITRNRIDTLAAEIAGKKLHIALATMERLVNELQEDVSAARLVPVDEIVQKFPRLVRNLALEQNKEISLVMEGRQIELDKAALDGLGEPLLHLLRNAVDHGIEHPGLRHSNEKPKRGTVRVVARREENHILIEVADDGAGIDVDRVRHAAVRRGIIGPEQAKALSEPEVLELIFSPGFTTNKEVTGLSGRGVGLDVVKTAAERLGGKVSVTTELGRGTCFTLRLPLATTIIQTLMISVGEHVFAIPSDIVLETLDVKPGDVRGVGKERSLVLRGEVIPFVTLTDLLNIPDQVDRRFQNAVIVHSGDQLVGVGVDTVLDQIENIIKPFDPVAQRLRGFSGGTILGDGRVALLLDIPALL
jgi:two-component system, chemotaxis family, sensor kinase CheA